MTVTQLQATVHTSVGFKYFNDNLTLALTGVRHSIIDVLLCGSAI